MAKAKRPQVQPFSMYSSDVDLLNNIQTAKAYNKNFPTDQLKQQNFDWNVGQEIEGKIGSNPFMEIDEGLAVYNPDTEQIKILEDDSSEVKSTKTLHNALVRGRGGLAEPKFFNRIGKQTMTYGWLKLLGLDGDDQYDMGNQIEVDEDGVKFDGEDLSLNKKESEMLHSYFLRVNGLEEEKSFFEKMGETVVALTMDLPLMMATGAIAGGVMRGGVGALRAFQATENAAQISNSLLRGTNFWARAAGQALHQTVNFNLLGLPQTIDATKEGIGPAMNEIFHNAVMGSLAASTGALGVKLGSIASKVRVGEILRKNPVLREEMSGVLGSFGFGTISAAAIGEEDPLATGLAFAATHFTNPKAYRRIIDMQKKGNYMIMKNKAENGIEDIFLLKSDGKLHKLNSYEFFEKGNAKETSAEPLEKTNDFIYYNERPSMYHVTFKEALAQERMKDGAGQMIKRWIKDGKITEKQYKENKDTYRMWADIATKSVMAEEKIRIFKKFELPDDAQINDKMVKFTNEHEGIKYSEVKDMIQKGWAEYAKDPDAWIEKLRVERQEAERRRKPKKGEAKPTAEEFVKVTEEFVKGVDGIMKGVTDVMGKVVEAKAEQERQVILQTKKKEIEKITSERLAEQKTTEKELIDEGEVQRPIERPEVVELLKGKYGQEGAEKIAVELTGEEVDYIVTAGREGKEVSAERLKELSVKPPGVRPSKSPGLAESVLKQRTEGLKPKVVEPEPVKPTKTGEEILKETEIDIEANKALDKFKEEFDKASGQKEATKAFDTLKEQPDDVLRRMLELTDFQAKRDDVFIRTEIEDILDRREIKPLLDSMVEVATLEEIGKEIERVHDFKESFSKQQELDRLEVAYNEKFSVRQEQERVAKEKERRGQEEELLGKPSPESEKRLDEIKDKSRIVAPRNMDEIIEDVIAYDNAVKIMSRKSNEGRRFEAFAEAYDVPDYMMPIFKMADALGIKLKASVGRTNRLGYWSPKDNSVNLSSRFFGSEAKGKNFGQAYPREQVLSTAIHEIVHGFTLGQKGTNFYYKEIAPQLEGIKNFVWKRFQEDVQKARKSFEESGQKLPFNYEVFEKSIKYGFGPNADIVEMVTVAFSRPLVADYLSEIVLPKHLQTEGTKGIKTMFDWIVNVARNFANQVREKAGLPAGGDKIGSVLNEMKNILNQKLPATEAELKIIETASKRAGEFFGERAEIKADEPVFQEAMTIWRGREQYATPEVMKEVREQSREDVESAQGRIDKFKAHIEREGINPDERLDATTVSRVTESGDAPSRSFNQQLARDKSIIEDSQSWLAGKEKQAKAYTDLVEGGSISDRAIEGTRTGRGEEKIVTPSKTTPKPEIAPTTPTEVKRNDSMLETKPKIVGQRETQTKHKYNSIKEKPEITKDLNQAYEGKADKIYEDKVVEENKSRDERNFRVNKPLSDNTSRKASEVEYNQREDETQKALNSDLFNKDPKAWKEIFKGMSGKLGKKFQAHFEFLIPPAFTARHNEAFRPFGELGEELVNGSARAKNRVLFSQDLWNNSAVLKALPEASRQAFYDSIMRYESARHRGVSGIAGGEVLEKDMTWNEYADWAHFDGKQREVLEAYRKSLDAVTAKRQELDALWMTEFDNNIAKHFNEADIKKYAESFGKIIGEERLIELEGKDLAEQRKVLNEWAKEDITFKEEMANDIAGGRYKDWGKTFYYNAVRPVDPNTWHINATRKKDLSHLPLNLQEKMAGDERIFTYAESQMQHEEIMNNLKNLGYEITDTYKVGDLLKDKSYANRLTEIEIRELADQGHIEYNNEVIDKLIDATKRGLNTHSIHKEFIPGMKYTSTEFDIQLHRFVNEGIQGGYKNYYLRKLETDLSLLKSKVNSGEEKLRTTAEYAQGYINQLRQPEKTWIDTIRFLTMTSHVGLIKPAFLAMQALQTVQTGLAEMVRNSTDIGGTTGEGFKAWNNAWTDAPMYQVGLRERLKVGTTTEEVARKHNLDVNKLKLLEQLQWGNKITASGVSEIMAISPELDLQHHTGYKATIGKLQKAVSAAGRGIERLTRMQTALGMMEIGQKKGLKGQPLYDFIATGIDKAMGEFGKGGRSPILYGRKKGQIENQLIHGLRKSMLTYKNYSFYNFGQWQEMIRNKQHSAIWVKAMVGLGLHGLKGMPLMASFMLLGDFFTDEDMDYEMYKLSDALDEEFGFDLGSAMLRGAPNLIGMDTSEMFAEITPLATDIFGSAWGDTWEERMNNIVEGAAVGFAKDVITQANESRKLLLDVIKGNELSTDKEIEKALNIIKKLSPISIRNPWNAMTMIEDGIEVRGKTMVVREDLDAIDIAYKFLSFPLAKQQRAYIDYKFNPEVEYQKNLRIITEANDYMKELNKKKNLKPEALASEKRKIIAIRTEAKQKVRELKSEVKRIQRKRKQSELLTKFQGE